MKNKVFGLTGESRSRKLLRVVFALALLIIPATIFNASTSVRADDNQSWSITLNQNTHLTGDQFEEYICAPNSEAGVPGHPPAKLMGWNSSLHTWEISLDRASILAANPNCPQTSYIASQIDSISPLSQTVNDQLYQQGSYRVMYPGRVATWSGVTMGSGFQQQGAIGEMTIGWQSGEPDVVNPDGTIDFSQYKVQSAAFGAVATADPFANLGINGGQTVRLNAFAVDYRQGTFNEELQTQYPASFFLQPHNYSIAWVDTSHFQLINTGCNHPFELVYSIDGQVVAVYTNGTTSENPFELAALQGAPLTGIDTRLNAKRCTVPEPTQMFAGMANSDAGGATVGNAAIPPVPLTMTIHTMSIQNLNH